MSFEQVWRSIANGQGLTELEQYLMAGGSIDAREPLSGWTLLHQACEHQNHRLLRALIERGANVNVRADNDAQDTPLHLAVDIDIDAAWQRTWDLGQIAFETARSLLEAGADPNARNAQGRTPREMVMGYGSELADQFIRLVSAHST